MCLEMQLPSLDNLVPLRLTENLRLHSEALWHQDRPCVLAYRVGRHRLCDKHSTMSRQLLGLQLSVPAALIGTLPTSRFQEAVPDQRGKCRALRQTLHPSPSLQLAESVGRPFQKAHRQLPLCTGFSPAIRLFWRLARRRCEQIPCPFQCMQLRSSQMR
mmetsp:Transcript_32160/g.76780  ORF Transcript_32160/g.76780 Transcript_32160/m.76780 type:complete len:159 (-) Transcript_32160:930-1406(-)